MSLRLLPETLVNRIAAGEVVERPAAALKELLENALDAGAQNVEAVLRDGGRSYLSVSDDGHGMTPEELALAVERHATSKLPEDDLVHIATLGFRGEALPSIGAVSRMTVTSRAAGATDAGDAGDAGEAWSLTVEGGRKGAVEPAALGRGTRVEVRDLFYATPARLKFLKSARAEQMQARDALTRLAMAHHEVGFILSDGQRDLLNLPAAQGELFESRLSRLAAILGRDFAENALPIDAEREGLRLTGHIGLPTLNRANAQAQYLFVNGRPVRDKLLYGAVRGAYRDFLAHDRHPILALFLEVPPDLVDVNVHPAKTEVRFRDPALVRGLIVSAAKHALAEAGHRASTTVSMAALGAFTPGAMIPGGGAGPVYARAGAGSTLPRGLAEAAAAYHAPLPGLAQTPDARPAGPNGETALEENGAVGEDVSAEA
jgi:DNA mismatch repair protein MutL